MMVFKFAQQCSTPKKRRFLLNADFAVPQATQHPPLQSLKLSFVLDEYRVDWNSVLEDFE